MQVVNRKNYYKIYKIYNGLLIITHILIAPLILIK